MLLIYLIRSRFRIQCDTTPISKTKNVNGLWKQIKNNMIPVKFGNKLIISSNNYQMKNVFAINKYRRRYLRILDASGCLGLANSSVFRNNNLRPVLNDTSYKIFNIFGISTFEKICKISKTQHKPIKKTTNLIIMLYICAPSRAQMY